MAHKFQGYADDVNLPSASTHTINKNIDTVFVTSLNI